MHKLFRNRYPETLSNYDFRNNYWREYIAIEKNKDDVWESIFEMQGKRCAYCECELTNCYKGHVEHFVKRDDDNRLVFEWTNLFGSCKRYDGCGFYKDNQKYNIENLIKVDNEDPDNFYTFLRDGSISIKPELSTQQCIKAQETLRVFNLDAKHGPLRQQRATAIKNYKNLTDEIEGYFMEYGCDQLLEELISDYLITITGLPFETALRHVVK